MMLHQVFLYLTLILLPTQLGRHFWPDWALVLGRRIDYLAPTIYLTDIMLITTICIWLIAKPVRQRLWNGVKTHIPLLLVSCIYIIINIWNSTNRMVTMYMWIKIMEYLALFYYLYKTKPSWIFVIRALSISMIYTSILAIIQFTLQHAVGGVVWILGERTFTIATPGIAKVNWCLFSSTNCAELLRPYATFPHPNVLAGFLAAIIPLVVLSWVKDRNDNWRKVTGSAMGLGIVTLALTFSRGAWIIGIILLAVALVKHGRKQSIRMRWYMAIGLFFCSIIAIPYIATLTKDAESVFMRTDLLSAAAQMLQQHYITGVGLGTFLINLPSVISGRSLYFLQPVHNIWLLSLAEIGILGGLLVGIWIIWYKKMVKQITKKGFLFVPLLVFLILGLIDHYPITVQQGQLATTIFFAFPFFRSNS